MRNLCWNKNVVALGLSSGFLEPLESTSIHLVQSGIARLISLFPDKRFNPAERDEYNRQMKALYEDVRDFIILHYKATKRDDTPFWDFCRTMEVPESLQQKIDLWKAKGRTFRDNMELFQTTSYVAVMLGQGIVPEEHEPSVDGLDEQRVAGAMDQMREAYLQMAQKLPSHAEFIGQIVGKKQPEPDLPEFSF
jgi:tryptophan halogenase